MLMVVIPLLTMIVGLAMLVSVTVDGAVFVLMLVVVYAVVVTVIGCILRIAVTRGLAAGMTRRCRSRSRLPPYLVTTPRSSRRSVRSIA